MSAPPPARLRPTSALPPNAHVVDSRMGDWRLVELLNETQYSRVFRAQPWDRPRNWHADYVVKMAIDADADIAPIANALIRREACVAKRICDPHVVPVLEVQEKHAPTFFVMPFFEGQNVAERMATSGRLPLAIALWVARQTVLGLEAIHQSGFLHGDIKPENVIVGTAGHLTVADLAYARPIDVSRGEQDCLMTTIRYAAPELFRGGELIGAGSDVYSLGVMLYEMLTGAPPFRQEDVAELINAHLDQQPPEPHLSSPLPPRVARLLRSMLSKQPLRRPSLSELKRTLIDLEIEWLAERAA